MTVATSSFYHRRVIKEFLVKTGGDLAGLDVKVEPPSPDSVSSV